VSNIDILLKEDNKMDKIEQTLIDAILKNLHNEKLLTSKELEDIKEEYQRLSDNQKTIAENLELH